MANSIEDLRRQASELRRSFVAGEPRAVRTVRAAIPDAEDITPADALHVIALGEGHTSWPGLRFAYEAEAMDRESRAERLKVALFFGQHWVTEALLRETPDLGRDNFGLACALYDVTEVQRVLARNPSVATQRVGIRRPMTHLAFSQHIHGSGSGEDMLAVAAALVDAGADVNDHYNYNGNVDSPLSALYGALGHANNLSLAEWLLDRGADPNDGESLYHSTELGHRRGLRLLLERGARPEGTNALPRALDFNDHEAVSLLLNAGADPNEGIAEHPSGEPPMVIPALHQAARRMCDERMVEMLLSAGADPSSRHEGLTPYALARVYGNSEAAKLIAAAGGNTELNDDEALLTTAVDGPIPENRYINPVRLNDEYRNLLRALLQFPDRMGHVRRLVALGLEYDRPDEMGLTPVQLAGWEGLPEMMGYFLRLKPDLSHINAYGGTLLSTIIHGSENCPTRADRDHIACARLAFEEGVALPTRAIELAGEPEMAEFLADWAEARPGQVIKGGIG